MQFLVALLVFIGTTILTWAYQRFIAKKPQLPQAPWEVPTIASGTPIPVLLGTQRVRPIVVCYLGEETEDIIGGGSFVTGKQVVGTQHKVTYQGLLCWGPIAAYRNLVLNDTTLASRVPTRRTAVAVDVNGKVIYATSSTISFDHDAGGAGVLIFGRGKVRATVDLRDIYAKYDGVGGNFTLYFGTGQTGPDPVLEAAKGAGFVPDYRELAYVVFDRFRMGMDPTRPIDLVLTKGTGVDGFVGLGEPRMVDVPGALAAIAGGWTPWTVQDVTIPAALYALFQDRRWALPIDASEIDLAQFVDVHHQTSGNVGDGSTEVTGVSVLLTSQQQAKAFVDECLQVLNAALVRHPETNKYQLKLIRNETPNQAAIDALRSFDESAIKSCKVTQRSWAETYNEVVVEFSNPELLFNTDTVVARNDASIAATGGIRSITIRCPSVTDPTVAQRIALRELRASSTVLEKQTLTMTRAAWDVTQGDVFKVTFAPVGYTNRILRCLSTSLGRPWANEVTVEAIDDVFAHEEPPVTIVPRDPVPPSPVVPVEPDFRFTIEYADAAATVTLIVIDPDSRLASVSYAVSVGHVDLVTEDGGYTDVPLVEPYTITVPRDAVEQTWLHLAATYLDRNGNAATWSTIIDIYPTNTPVATPTDLDGSSNPIEWDTAGKAVDAKTAVIDGSRSLVIENAVPGFHGTLTVTSTGVGGYTLTLPAGSIYGDGSSLDVALGAKDQFSVYYDGTYFWWDLVTHATIVPAIPLAASLAAGATLTAALPDLAAALTASGSTGGDLSI